MKTEKEQLTELYYDLTDLIERVEKSIKAWKSIGEPEMVQKWTKELPKMKKMLKDTTDMLAEQN